MSAPSEMTEHKAVQQYWTTEGGWFELGCVENAGNPSHGTPWVNWLCRREEDPSTTYHSIPIREIHVRVCIGFRVHTDEQSHHWRVGQSNREALIQIVLTLEWEVAALVTGKSLASEAWTTIKNWFDGHGIQSVAYLMTKLWQSTMSRTVTQPLVMWPDPLYINHFLSLCFP